MSKLKGLEKTHRKRICSSSKDFPRPFWGRYISAALAKSGPLDITSEKSFLLFFTHENGLGHMFQKQFSYSPILLFLRRHKPKMIFGQTNPMDSDRKC